MMITTDTQLRIETAENGFVVYSGMKEERYAVGRQWAFETAGSLAKFIKEWGELIEKGPEIPPLKNQTT